jgi:hypothetical protein
MNQVTVMLKPPAAGADMHILQVLAAGLPEFFANLTVRTNSVQGRVASLIFTADEGVVTDAQFARLIECVNGLRAPFLLVPSGVETIRQATLKPRKAAPTPPPPPPPAPEPAPPAPEPDPAEELKKAVEEDEKAKEEADESPADDYGDMKKSALIELAKERGIAWYGSKADITERLRAADAGGDVEVNPDDVTIEE